jgi:hypothetical protein
MSKHFRELRDRMSPAARQTAESRTREILYRRYRRPSRWVYWSELVRLYFWSIVWMMIGWFRRGKKSNGKRKERKQK